MTLTPVESTHLAAVGYEEDAERLTIQFVNGDTYEYNFVPAPVCRSMISAGSIGSFFSTHIRPNFPGEKIHTGTLAERAEIWLRTAKPPVPELTWVALGMGHPVSVLGYGSTEFEARSSVGQGGDGEFAVMEFHE